MKREIKNAVKIGFPSLSHNEGFARNTVAAFLLGSDPALNELIEVKTAVSEAVTNSIVHGYPDSVGRITLTLSMGTDNVLKVSVCDRGTGIENIEEARTPLFTTSTSGEQAGMGFTVMETFMDKVTVASHPGKGTRVTMYKKITSKTGDSAGLR